MPEIAEVETVRRVLKKRILKKRITNVLIIYPKIIEGDKEEFKKILEGNEFVDIKRRGKWLIFELHNHYLLSHLRMEGKYFIKDKDEIINKHEHIILTLEDNMTLRYHDTRKFGRMKIISKSDLDSTEEIKKQGLEPLDKNLTGEYLINKFKGKRLPIKTTLLDQTIISGLGNIYVDEVLFESKIHPLKETKDLNKEECEKIIDATNKIIPKAIIEGGTTIKSYTSSLGVSGNYQNFLKVHKRDSKECLLCGTKIVKIKVNGRGTYFCPTCQKI